MAETFHTVLAAEVVLPKIDNVNSNLQGVLRLLERLGGESRKLAVDFQKVSNEYKNGLQNGFASKKKEEEILNSYKKQLAELKASLKEEGIFSKALFSNSEAQVIKKFTSLTNDLSRALNDLKKNAKLQEGTLGLDARNITSANRALKDLNASINSVQFLWRNDKGNEALKAQLITLAQNRAAVRDLIKSMEDKSKAEKVSQAFSEAWDAAHIENAKKDRKRELAEWKAFFKAKEALAKEDAAKLKSIYEHVTGSMIPVRSGRDIFKTLTDSVESQPYAVDAAKNRAMLYKLRRQDEATQLFSDSAKNQFNYRKEGRNLFSNDVYTNARIDAQKRNADEFLLSEQWKMAGGGATKFASSRLGDSEATRAITASILGLQQQIVALAKTENLTIERRKELMDKILEKETARKESRQQDSHNYRMNNPQADQRYIDFQTNKVSTGSRSALLQVQAILQANYAILNTFNSAIRLAITNTVEYEAALKDMQAISGSTNLEMSSLDKTVRGISTTTKFSAVEISDAGKLLAQAGMTAREIQAALPSITTLATATGSTLKETVDLVTSVVGVFDKTVADIPDVGNKISATLNMSKANAESLRLGLSYVGSTAKETGVSLEETLASFGAMTNAGIKSGSTLGTGMRQILVEMQKPSQEFVDTLGRVGLTVADVDVKSKGWTHTLKTLRDAGFQASDAIKSFDVRGASAFNALLGNAGDIDKIVQSYSDHTAAIRASETQMDSLKSQIALLSNNFTDLITNALTPTFEVFKVVASSATWTIQALKPFTPLIAALTPAIIGLGVAIVGSLLSSTISAIPILSTLGTKFLEAKKAAELTTGSFTLLNLATSAGVATGTMINSVTTLSASITAAGGAATYFGGAIKGAFTAAITGAIIQVKALWLLMVGNPFTAAFAVITSVAAAVMAFGSNSATAKDRVDELKTSMNENESAIEKTKEALDKIDTTIAKVSSKNDLLKTGLVGTVQETDLLRSATDQANSVLSAFGRSVDSGTSSLDQMVSKLRETRNEMLALQEAQKDRAIVNAGLMAVANQNVAEEATKDTSRTKMMSLITSLPNKEKVVTSNGYTRDYSEVIDTFGKYTGALKDFPKLSELTNAFAEIGNSKTLSEGRKKEFTEQSQILLKAVTAMEDSKKSIWTMENLIASKKDDVDYRAFIGDRGKVLQGKDILQDTTKARALQEKVDPIKNQARYLEIAAEEAGKLQGAIQGIIDDATRRYNSNGDDAINEKTYREVMLRANNAKQAVTAEYNSVNLSPYSANVKAGFKAEVSNLDSEISNMIKSRTSTLGEVLKTMEAKQAVELKELKLTVAASGNNDYPQQLAALEKKHKEERVKVTLQMNEAAREASAKGLAQTKAALQEAIDAQNMKASNAFKAVNPFSTLKEIDALAQESLAALNESLRLEMIKFEKDWADKRKQPGYVKDNELIARQGKELQAEEARRGNQQQFNQAKAKAWANETFGTRNTKEANAKSDSEEAMLALNKFKGEKDAQASQLAIIRGKTGDVSDARIRLLELERNKQEIAALNAYLDEESSRLDTLMANTSQAAKVVEDLTKMKEEAKTSGKDQGLITEQLTKAQEQLTAAAKNELQARKEIKKTEEEIASKKVVEGKNGDVVEMKKNLDDAWKAYNGMVKEMDVNSILGTGMLNIFKSSTSTISAGLVDIATGATTVGGAFRSMALTVAKAMLQVVAQMAALQMVKTALGIAGSIWGAGSTSAGPSSTAMGMDATSGSYSSGGWLGDTSGFRLPTPSVGGQALPGAFAYSSTPVQKFARGGPVRGGISGKDSVPALLMPGEFIIKKSVVDAVGANFFHGLNQQGNAVVQSSQASMAPAPGKSEGLGGTVNVWVVTPDQKPSSMGPKDIIATVSDDINRNGSIKKLIKQVQMGQV